MQVVNAGSSSHMAADNLTGCLPDVWQFCQATPAGVNTNLMCPSVVYRRPLQVSSNKLSQVGLWNIALIALALLLWLTLQLITATAVTAAGFDTCLLSVGGGQKAPIPLTFQTKTRFRILS